MVHWIYEIADKVEERAKSLGKKKIILNGGLSVSGLQHIGRLRGEVLIGEAVRKILERRGYEVEQKIVLYTQDAWKGKEKQLSQFYNRDEAKKYIGNPLIKVPDPLGCHANWVEHYWSDFGGVLNEFSDGKIEIVYTTDMYRNSLKQVVKEIIGKREKVRQIVNKYRGRKPYPEGWIPFEPICQKCGRIDTTETVEVNGEIVKYRCKFCGHEGQTTLNDGKLNWRLEWAGVWKALDIDFEPFGKDHATPGGSRDSCVELAKDALEIVPPVGLPYEWVAIREGNKEMDMGSSDFIGITPKQWLEIAHPEVLRYLYYLTPPRKRIVIDLREIPQYYEQYYTAERLYYAYKNGKELTDEEKEHVESYEFSLLRDPPAEIPLQISYYTISLLVQSLPSTNLVEYAIKRLKSSSILRKELSKFDIERLKELLEKSAVWVSKYAPEHVKFKIIEDLPKSISQNLKFRNELTALGEKLVKLENWDEESIKNAMIEYTKNMDSEKRKEFYSELYMIIVGKNSGPRAAPLITILGKEFIQKRFLKDILE